VAFVRIKRQAALIIGMLPNRKNRSVIMDAVVLGKLSQRASYAIAVMAIAISIASASGGKDF